MNPAVVDIVCLEYGRTARFKQAGRSCSDDAISEMPQMKRFVGIWGEIFHHKCLPNESFVLTVPFTFCKNCLNCRRAHRRTIERNVHIRSGNRYFFDFRSPRNCRRKLLSHDFCFTLPVKFLRKSKTSNRDVTKLRIWWGTDMNMFARRLTASKDARAKGR